MRKKRTHYPRVCLGKLKFVAYITDPKTGEVRWARDYGLRGWPICEGSWVNNDKAADAPQPAVTS